MDNQKLTKKERKDQEKKEWQEKSAKEKRGKFVKKWSLIIFSILLIGIGGWWIIKESNKPLPGESVKDLGREHVDIGKTQSYNSNPPASGPHYTEWTRAGIYDSPGVDEYLVHSLEHGYIIISYNCEKKAARLNKEENIVSRLIGNAYAHDHELILSASGSAESSPSAKLSEKPALTSSSWQSKECKDFQKQLTDFAKKERLWKLILIPRPSLDKRIALTAWARVYKFNPSNNELLSEVEKSRMSVFINAFRDKGPEQTMEP